MPALIWWGRSDPGYSRNRIIREHLRALGWEIIDFRPWLSPFGDFEAVLRRLPKARLVWVPCFRQRDLAAARRFAARRAIPFLADPLISAYDKQTGEREKFSADSREARRLRAWESRLLQAADRVLADTEEHARFFHETLGIERSRLAVVPVGAEEALFYPEAAPRVPQPPFTVLFYGSFIHLQGPQHIVEAARLYQGPAAVWTLIGTGPLHAECVSRAAGLDNVRFVDWVPYAELPEKVRGADILLGVFGGTPKAGRVIPNKVYQSLACGKPTVTRHAPAYPPAVQSGAQTGLIWVPPADPAALAAAVARLALAPDGLVPAGRAARETYENHFSGTRVRQALASALQGLCG